MLQPEQDNSAAVTDRTNFMHSHNLLQGAAGILSAARNRKKGRSTGQLIENIYLSKIHIGEIIFSG